MKQLILVLLSFILFVSNSQNTSASGNFQPFTELSSPQLQSVLSFVSSIHPETKNFLPSNVSRQVVNGFNYKLTLSSVEGCQVVAIVYVPINGSKNLTSYQALPCNNSKASVNGSAGGSVAQPNPSSSTYQRALSLALYLHPQYLRSDLVLSQTQVSHGVNYRFTFRNGDGTLNQVNIFIPLLKDYPDTEATVSLNPTLGYIQEITDPKDYQDIVKAVYKQFPEVKHYTIVGVEVQAATGRNFRIGLQLNGPDQIKYVSFKGSIDLYGKATVFENSWIDVSGYSVDAINQVVEESIKKHPQLKGLLLVSIENIWPSTSEGLKLIFSSGSARYKIYAYKSNGKALNLIY